MNNRVDQQEELLLIKEYIRWRSLQNQDIYLVESPITSIKTVSDNKSISDAIISVDGTKQWLEVTTISRSPEMREQMGLLAKKPENFKGQSIIPGVSIASFQPLDCNFFEALKKKDKKDYSEFTASLNLPSQGTLLVMVCNNDPFLNELSYNELVGCISDEHLLYGCDLNFNFFNKIVFGAFIQGSMRERGSWEWRFNVIANASLLSRIKDRRLEKTNIIAQIKEEEYHCK